MSRTGVPFNEEWHEIPHINLIIAAWQYGGAIRIEGVNTDDIDVEITGLMRPKTPDGVHLVSPITIQTVHCVSVDNGREFTFLAPPNGEAGMRVTLKPVEELEPVGLAEH